MKKTIIACLFVATSLSTWASDTPVSAQEWAKQSSIQAAKTIKKSETKIVAYFSAKGKKTNYPIRNGYYRVLLGYSENGQKIIQDYYQNTAKKAMDPAIVQAGANLNEFNVKFAGNVTTYNPNGEVESFIKLDNGERLEGFYQNGQLLVVFNYGENKAAFFYPNGNKMAETSIRYGGEEFKQLFDASGQLIFDAKKDATSLSDNASLRDQVAQINQKIKVILSETGLKFGDIIY